MTSQLIIYGKKLASDYLIEVEGHITAEFPAHEEYGDAGGFLAFSDGTLLSLTLTDEEIWKISAFSVGEKTTYEIYSTTEGYDYYSDRVVLTGEFIWVVMGTDLARKERA